MYFYTLYFSTNKHIIIIIIIQTKVDNLLISTSIMANILKKGKSASIYLELVNI